MRPMVKGFLLGLCVLWLLVALCFLVESHQVSPQRLDLQRQFGGLGLGAHLVPTSCFFLFDPRIEPHCPNLQRPLPALPNFCPRHSTTVSLFPAARAVRGNSGGVNAQFSPGRFLRHDK